MHETPSIKTGFTLFIALMITFVSGVLVLTVNSGQSLKLNSTDDLAVSAGDCNNDGNNSTCNIGSQTCQSGNTGYGCDCVQAGNVPGCGVWRCTRVDPQCGSVSPPPGSIDPSPNQPPPNPTHSNNPGPQPGPTPNPTAVPGPSDDDGNTIDPGDTSGPARTCNTGGICQGKRVGELTSANCFCNSACNCQGTGNGGVGDACLGDNSCKKGLKCRSARCFNPESEQSSNQPAQPPTSSNITCKNPETGQISYCRIDKVCDYNGPTTTCVDPGSAAANLSDIATYAVQDEEAIKKAIAEANQIYQEQVEAFQRAIESIQPREKDDKDTTTPVYQRIFAEGDNRVEDCNTNNPNFDPDMCEVDRSAWGGSRIDNSINSVNTSVQSFSSESSNSMNESACYLVGNVRSEMTIELLIENDPDALEERKFSDCACEDLDVGDNLATPLNLWCQGRVNSVLSGGEEADLEYISRNPNPEDQ